MLNRKAKTTPFVSNFFISHDEVVYDGKNHEVSVFTGSDISGMGGISSISKLKLGSFTIKKVSLLF